ncbi:hypothetical protein ACLMJK_001477 [Lecanora helva]
MSVPDVPAIKDLPLTDPRCNNISCTAFYAAYNHSQATLSYYRQYDYGHWLAWYYAAFIFIAMLVYIATLYLNTRPLTQEAAKERPTIVDKIQAYRRFVTYRRLPDSGVSGSLGLPSVGMLIFLLVGVGVVASMSFAIQPYYRLHRGYGSPPLAVRTGLMAASLTPLLIALGGKVNLVTMVTGIGYEKLNVIHRWVGWIIFGLSVTHTIPFFVAPLWDGGYAALHHQFYEPDSFEYTGIAPLAILFGIVVFSIPWVRHRFYETFYWLHWCLGASYLGLCFWHFAQEGDSWTYLWAALGLWLISILGRSFYKNSAFKLDKEWSSYPSHLSIMPGDVTRIDAYLPIGVKWEPGQHFYLRFPTLFPFDNHPFTVANIPDPSHKNESLVQKATFFARPHSGFTKKIAAYASANVDNNEAVWLEGPYGGISRDIARRCNTLILIAGGSGITACLSWLLHCAEVMAVGEGPLQCVKLVWIVRAKEHTEWISEELENAKNLLRGDNKLQLIFYITRSGFELKESGSLKQANSLEQKDLHVDDKNMMLEKSSSSPHSFSPSSLGVCHAGRPSVATVMPGLLGSGRNMIIGCGPESLKIDVANTCAVMQKRVLNGDCTEVALHSESFGWG